jgi:predicted amino acid-binding ACT domain protein
VRLNLTGVDHPGIVREVSSALARHGVSINELHTEVRRGSTPWQYDWRAVRTELERIANDVMVELALTESDNAKAD